MFEAVKNRSSGAYATPWAFHRATSRSPDLIERLELQRRLDEHEGCVNTVSFTPEGDTLISGSDDQQIILWEWETGMHPVPGSRRVHCGGSASGLGAWNAVCRACSRSTEGCEVGAPLKEVTPPQASHDSTTSQGTGTTYSKLVHCRTLATTLS